MARTVTLSLLGLNRLSKPLTRAGKDVDTLDDKIEDFNESGQKLSKSFDSAAKSAGKLGEADKSLEKVRAAADKAKQQVTKSSEALDKARTAEAAAAAKTAQAEAKLTQTRKKSTASAEQIHAAELQVTAAKVKEEAATKAVTARSQELTKARSRAADASSELTVASQQAAEANRMAVSSVDSDRVDRSRGGLLKMVGALGSVGAAGGKMAGKLGKAFGSVRGNVWVMVAVVTAALAALPALGATAGALMAVGFGAGIAGIGLAAAAQSQKVKDTFSQLKEDVVADLRSMAAPLEGTLVDAAGHMRSAFDELSPSLQQAFSDAAPVLSQFSQQLFSALGDWGPVIDSASAAFTKGLEALGPELQSQMGAIGSSLTGLFDTIAANPDLFSGLVSGLLGFVNGLITTVHWLTRAHLWIKDNIPGGIIGLISPLGTLATHLVTTANKGGALSDKLAVMGSAFKEAWGFISSGATELIATVKPIFNEIITAVANSDVLEKVSTWWNQIAQIISLAGELIGVIFQRIADVVGVIWENFGQNIIQVFSGLWTAVSAILTGAFEVIKGIFNVLIGVLTGNWSRAWEGVKQVFSGLWTAIVGILSGALTFLKGILGAALTAIQGTWSAVWGWVSSFFGGIWSWIVSRVTAAKNLVVAAVTILRTRAVEIFTNIRDWILARVMFVRRWLKLHFLRAKLAVLRAVMELRKRAVDFFTNIRDWILDKARSLRDKVVDAFNALKKRSIDAFSNAKDGIKKVWDKVQAAAKEPVNFIIGTVYTSGIKEFWDSIAGKIGMDPLPTLKELAAGGVLEGYKPGVDTIPAMLSEGEGVLVPQAVRSLGPGFVHAANALKGRAGELVGRAQQGFARGGIAGAVGDFISKGKDFFSDGFMKALNQVTGPITDTLVEEHGRSGLTGLPVRMVEHIIGQVKDFLKDFADVLSGGSGKEVVEEARKYIGDPGGSDANNIFTRAYGMSGQPWCGMFVGEVFDRAGASKAISDVPHKPAVRSYRNLPTTSQANARPGDLALYRGDDGHINIVADPDRKETIGGNESNTVRKQLGYMNSASSIRRPEFARGGIATKSDLLGVLDQDRAVNTRRTTPELTNMLRQATGLRHYTTSASQTVAEAAPIARALGGPVVPGQTYRVGEDGPEEMTVGTRAHVTPVSGAPTYNLDLRGAVITGGKREFEDMVVGAISQAERKGRVRAGARR